MGSQPISHSSHARRLLQSRCDSAQGSTWLVVDALVPPASALAGVASERLTVGVHDRPREWRFVEGLLFFSPGRSAAMSFPAGLMGMPRPW